MKIQAFLNNQPLASAFLEEFGLLTASVVRQWRHPDLAVAGAPHSSIPEIGFRLGGVRHHEHGDESFVACHVALKSGDRLSLVMGCPSEEEYEITQTPTELSGELHAVSLDVHVDGVYRYRAGISGFGLLSCLMVDANRHPSRLKKKNGEPLPQLSRELVVSANDHNDSAVLRQHVWPRINLPEDCRIVLVVGESENPDKPASSKEHR